jgi:tetratricopeptide (TPR) repeat protein
MKKGIELYESGKYNEALRHFRSIQVDEDSYAEISYYLGLCYAQLEQYDEALIYLDQVIASAEDFAQAYQSRMLIGYIYATTGRYRLAEYEFQRLLDEGYDSSKVHAALGYILYKQGNIPASIKNLEEALAIREDNATALNSMAYIMADQGIQLPKAKEYVRRALELRPEHPAYLDTFGWILYKLGDLVNAERVLKRARELDPRTPDIKEHLDQVKKAGMIDI